MKCIEVPNPRHSSLRLSGGRGTCAGQEVVPESFSSVGILLMFDHLLTLTLFFFVESLLRNFLLTTHDVTETEISNS